MKNTFKIMAVAVMSLTLGFVACTKPENDKPDNDHPGNEQPGNLVNAADHYAFHYNSQAVAAGDTVTYDVTRQDRDNQEATITLIPENITSDSLTVTQEVVLVQGPADMNDITVCGGGNCPWNGQPYTLQPGINDRFPISLDISLSNRAAGTTAVYRVALADTDMTHATYIYMRVNL